jgi:hypothetical protein
MCYHPIGFRFACWSAVSTTTIAATSIAALSHHLPFQLQWYDYILTSTAGRQGLQDEIDPGKTVIVCEGRLMANNKTMIVETLRQGTV